MLSLVLIFLLPAQRASAHSPLESSTPEAGASVTTMPAQIGLTFGAAVREAGVTVVLADERGSDWTAGPAIVEHGTVVSATVKPDAPDASWVLVGVFVVVGVLLVYMACGLITVYGRHEKRPF